jgi:hypothetical protein
MENGKSVKFTNLISKLTKAANKSVKKASVQQQQPRNFFLNTGLGMPTTSFGKMASGFKTAAPIRI